MCVCVERIDFNRQSNTHDSNVPGEVTVPFEVGLRFFSPHTKVLQKM